MLRHSLNIGSLDKLEFPSSKEDKFIWRPNPMGEFTVNSSYLSLLEDNSSPGCLRKVWNQQLIPKINFFWWTALQDNVFKRVFQFSNRYVLCKQEENPSHLLFHCTFTKTLWGLVLQKLDFSWVMDKDLQLFVLGRCGPHITL
ncbi:hypothetical protein SUGI_0626240 [Cryptomeria japonica]|nr:hypothetical protein SUGI_0626240 [Cryptomeria japonica]